jgi:hypothetical protein
MQGTSTVLANLNREIQAMKTRTVAGLTEAALVIKYDSVKNTPIDWGNLRSSCFIVVTGGGENGIDAAFAGPEAGDMSADHSSMVTAMRAEVGGGYAGLTGLPDRLMAVVAYSASYALYVHEMPGHYNFNSGGNKFLQRALEKNHKRVLKILAKHAKVK